MALLAVVELAVHELEGVDVAGLQHEAKPQRAGRSGSLSLVSGHDPALPNQPERGLDETAVLDDRPSRGGVGVREGRHHAGLDLRAPALHAVHRHLGREGERGGG